MMVIVSKTKVYPNKQTIIPKEIREALNVEENNIIEWDLDKDNNVKLIFKKEEKKPSFNDIVGIISTDKKTNAVDLVKDLYQ